MMNSEFYKKKLGFKEGYIPTHEEFLQIAQDYMKKKGIKFRQAWVYDGKTDKQYKIQKEIDQ